MPMRIGTLRLLEAIRILGLAEQDAILPGFDVRALRQGAGNPATRNHALLSPQSLRRGKALRLLDHRQLSRSLWHACLERHSVQS